MVFNVYEGNIRVNYIIRGKRTSNIARFLHSTYSNKMLIVKDNDKLVTYLIFPRETIERENYAKNPQILSIIQNKNNP